MSVHKVALVGAGRMGALHAANVVRSPRLTLAAIADHNRSLAEDLAQSTGAAVSTIEEILADGSIEAVLVASSTSSHLDNVQAAVRAGKAVFCEKPLSLNADLLAAALPSLEATGKPIFVAFKLPESFQALGEIAEFIRSTSLQNEIAEQNDQAALKQ